MDTHTLWTNGLLGHALVYRLDMEHVGNTNKLDVWTVRAGGCTQPSGHLEPQPQAGAGWIMTRGFPMMQPSTSLNSSNNRATALPTGDRGPSSASSAARIVTEGPALPAAPPIGTLTARQGHPSIGGPDQRLLPWKSANGRIALGVIRKVPAHNGGAHLNERQGQIALRRRQRPCGSASPQPHLQAPTGMSMTP